MKALFALSALFLTLSLTACGGGHGTKAVEVVEAAEANAKALAPTAEPIKFDDENLPKMGESAATSTDTTATDTAATTDTAAPASDAEQATKPAESQSAEATASTDTTKTN